MNDMLSDKTVAEFNIPGGESELGSDDWLIITFTDGYILNIKCSHWYGFIESESEE